MAFLRCDNPKVLAFERTYREDRLVVIANLARSSQAVVVEFPSPMRGFYLMDAVDRSVLPPIGSTPYGVSLPAHECCWFQLVASPAVEPITGREAVRSVL
jgi:maltose alpha-D-glucosyltransferase/alpha-amylase